jgi:maleylacetoacetate isomerase
MISRSVRKKRGVTDEMCLLGSVKACEPSQIYKNMSPSVTLYTNPISDCAARVRIALNLKNLPYSSITIDLANQGNLDPEYIKISPSGTIPTLVIDYNNGHYVESGGDGSPVILTQSLATLEYLEEAFPDYRRLLPSFEYPTQRAQVRTLVNIIASDIHPLTAPRVSRLIQEKFHVPAGFHEDENSAPEMSVKKWDVHWIERGLNVYERTLKSSGMMGRFSVGNEITLADVVLVPELWTAEQFGIDLPKYPEIFRIYTDVMEIEEVGRARQKGKGVRTDEV